MPETVSASAPGRVNLIGEHTDYHDGFVLPAPIPRRTTVHLERRSDRLVRARSSSISNDRAEFEIGRERPGRGWLDYVQGVTAALVNSGRAIGGFDVQVESTIPLGAGVSSSAALEVALLRGIRALFDLDLDDVAVAQLAFSAETGFVGVPVGIMDQMAASLGRDGEALFLDTRTLDVKHLPIPASIEVAVIDSGIRHRHAGGDYAVRRRESFEAAALLGVGRLRDLDADQLPRLAALPATLARRARHVVTENERVVEAVKALAAADAVRLGALFAASHASMRDDYEVSTPEIDTLVEIARRHADVYGARLTGGGFGGAVVVVARAEAAAAAAHDICDAYRRETSRDGEVLVPVDRAGFMSSPRRG
jgi:galactokinase